MPESLSTTPIERYLARSGHGSGMVFSFVLILDGSIEVDLLRKAWLETVQQHPCLFARLVGRGWFRRWEMQTQCDPESFVHHSIAFDAVRQKTDWVDPQQGFGIRCVVSSDDRVRWSVRIIFHHACCDGVGAIRVFGQFAKRYQALLEASASVVHDGHGVGSLESILSSNSRGRLRSGRNASTPNEIRDPAKPIGDIPNLRHVWTTIRGKNVRLSQLGSIPLVDSSRTPAVDAAGLIVVEPSERISQFQNHCRVLLTTETTDQIKRRLKYLNIKLNDWAIAITMEVLSKMTQRLASESNYLMVLNPVEMRSWRDRHNSRNHIGLALIRRRHQDLRDFDNALSSLSRQMTDVRKHGIAAELEFGLTLAEKIPWGVSLVESIGLFTPTVSLTCLTGLRLGKRLGVRQRDGGDWIGDARIDEIFFDAPIQKGADLSMAAWDFRGRLAISCRSRPCPSGSDSSLQVQFLSRWLEVANQWAGRLSDSGNTD